MYRFIKVNINLTNENTTHTYRPYWNELHIRKQVK